MLRAATTRERLRVITGLFVAVVPCCSGQSRVSSSGVRGCEARGPMCEPQRLGCRLMQISHLNACERDSRGAFVRTDGEFSSPLCRYHGESPRSRRSSGLRSNGPHVPISARRPLHANACSRGAFVVSAVSRILPPLAVLTSFCTGQCWGFAALLGRTPLAGPSTPPLRRVRMLWLYPANAGVTSRRLWIAGLNRRCAAIKMQGKVVIAACRSVVAATTRESVFPSKMLRLCASSRYRGFIAAVLILFL